MSEHSCTGLQKNVTSSRRTEQDGSNRDGICVGVYNISSEACQIMQLMAKKEKHHAQTSF